MAWLTQLCVALVGGNWLCRSLGTLAAVVCVGVAVLLVLGAVLPVAAAIVVAVGLLVDSVSATGCK